MISEQKDLRAIKAVFELRTTSECGFLPQLVQRTGLVPSTMDLHSIWTQKKELCSAPTVLQRQAKAATWMPGSFLRCGNILLSGGQKIFCFQDLHRQPEY